MKYHTLFFPKLVKISQNLTSAAVMIGALRVKKILKGCLILHVLTTLGAHILHHVGFIVSFILYDLIYFKSHFASLIFFL